MYRLLRVYRIEAVTVIAVCLLITTAAPTLPSDHDGMSVRCPVAGDTDGIGGYKGNCPTLSSRTFQARRFQAGDQDGISGFRAQSSGVAGDSEGVMGYDIRFVLMHLWFR